MAMAAAPLAAQQPDSLAPAQPARHYVARYTTHPPTIDGRLNDAAWRAAPWSDAFVDIEGDLKPAPRLRTRMKMVWDSTALYIAAELVEPDLWATLTQRDAVIFHDNDFEVFMDPDGDQLNYFELEINALGTVWDLFLPKPYRFGGHARNEFDMTRLRSAVHLDGTLNHPGDRDKGWTVELAIPYEDLRQPEITTPVPRAGDVWRINFSRVEWNLAVDSGRYLKRDSVPTPNHPHPEDNWVWSPQGVINMHIPERWGYLEFADRRGRR